MEAKKVVVIGGGTGTSTVLRALRGQKKVSCTAIVSTMDDGGSSGRLRKQFAIPSPGDIRQCIAALLPPSDKTGKLLQHRITQGELKGHTVGNILLASLTLSTGSIATAADTILQTVHAPGSVLPITNASTTLIAKLNTGKLLRTEHDISTAGLTTKHRIQSIRLSKSVRAYGPTLTAISRADLIIIAPGDLYASLLPNLLVKNVAKTIKAAKAPKVWVANLMAKDRFTRGFTVEDYVRCFAKYLGAKPFDTIIYNNTTLPRALKKFEKQDGKLIRSVTTRRRKDIRYIGAPLISKARSTNRKADPIATERSVIRHDEKKLTALLTALLEVPGLTGRK